MWTFVLINFMLIASTLTQNQQQENNNSNIADLVASVFDITERTPPNRGVGFGDIVTPEPIVEPTSQPQIFVNNGNRCTCVPYFMCDPTDGVVKEGGSVDGFGLIDIRFNPMSCQDVLDVCCEDNKTTSEPIQLPPVIERPNRPTGCGIRNVNGIDFEIVGNFNNEAGFGEFPWTVALLHPTEDKCICVGSLIHPQVVLTATHCVRNLNPQDVRVRAGEWDTQTTKERLPYQEQFAANIIRHPEYNNRSLANDVALIVLQQPFTLADHISTICLPPANFVSRSQNCYASGWGKDIFGQQGRYSVIMKRILLPIVPHNQCEASLRQTRLGNIFVLSPTFICAGGEKGVDTCQGDGGAPLVCPVGNEFDNRYAQMGIVAWGIGCNEARPAVYANVALARTWIDSQMNTLGYGTSTYTY